MRAGEIYGVSSSRTPAKRSSSLHRGTADIVMRRGGREVERRSVLRREGRSPGRAFETIHIHSKLPLVPAPKLFTALGAGERCWMCCWGPVSLDVGSSFTIPKPVGL